MAEKIDPAKDTVKREIPPKPQKVRDELRWPSASGAGGGAYIPIHDTASKPSGACEG
jgi:hypothetical protein